jgi:hypothetical protein
MAPDRVRKVAIRPATATERGHQADRELLEELHGWRPQRGVLSVCFEIDPADRSEGWRTALRERLKHVAEAGGAERAALKATAERVLDRFPGDSGHPAGRTRVGFLEIGEKGGAERWSAYQLPLGEPVAEAGERPLLRPLLQLLARGGRHRILLVSSERVVGWEWVHGDLRRFPEWDSDMGIVPGAERKAPAMADPARAQGVSSSGRDQFGQRLEANRERFLHEVGARISAAGPGFDPPIVLGEAPHVDAVLEGVRPPGSVHALEGQNLINEREERLAGRLEEVVAELNGARHDALVERAIGAVMASDGNGTAGVGAVEAALGEGRVEHLVYDSALDADVERMIASAFDTSASITPVRGRQAAMLAPHEGVAAILRY